MFAKELTNVILELVGSGLARDYNVHDCRRLPSGRSLVSWVTRHEATTRPRAEYASVDEYLGLLGSQQYSCILRDGSMLQIEYELERRNISWHRLCFYPNPFDVVWEEDDDRTIGEVIEDLTSEDGRDIPRLRTPVRFDYQPSDVGDLHSPCHMHIVRECCRVPVRSAVPPRVFFAFVFRSFYPEDWIEHRNQLFAEQLKRLGAWNTPATIETDDVQFAHLHWAISG